MMIFQWLKKRREAQAQSDARMIFRFHDGSQLHGVDPIRVIATLAEHKEYLPHHLAEAVDGVIESQQIVADAACEAFGVQPYDGKKAGMTVAERVMLMITFDTWTLALKKNIATSPTWQRSMA